MLLQAKQWKMIRRFHDSEHPGREALTALAYLVFADTFSWLVETALLTKRDLNIVCRRKAAILSLLAIVT